MSTYDRSGTYWAKLQVTAPNEMTSTQAKLTVNCAPSFSGFARQCEHQSDRLYGSVPAHFPL